MDLALWWLCMTVVGERAWALGYKKEGGGEGAGGFEGLGPAGCPAHHRHTQALLLTHTSRSPLQRETNQPERLHTESHTF